MSVKATSASLPFGNEVVSIGIFVATSSAVSPAARHRSGSPMRHCARNAEANSVAGLVWKVSSVPAVRRARGEPFVCEGAAAACARYIVRDAQHGILNVLGHTLLRRILQPTV